MKSVDLFVGAGGLALGVSRAGFRHLLVTDRDANAIATIRENQLRCVRHVRGWPLCEGDVRQLDYSVVSDDVDLLAAGPPCQPFSFGGNHRAHRDERDMFSEVARAVRQLRPRAILLENVSGLVRTRFQRYFGYILLQLAYPELVREVGEVWPSHLSRLVRFRDKGTSKGLAYEIGFAVLNAADYGVPQFRKRVFILGFRSDCRVKWRFPAPTHSLDALLIDQWITGEYWDRHGIARRHIPEPTPRLRPRINRLGRLSPPQPREPWRTVRDALVDLPVPSKNGNSPVPDHQFIPGARIYSGHTGSPWDQPAKTLKAGNHGVPGGENMLLIDDGTVRYFTVREAARLQTFPDDFVFPGLWSKTTRQLGNAVPVKLGEALAREVRLKLMESPVSTRRASG